MTPVIVILSSVGSHKLQDIRFPGLRQHGFYGTQPSNQFMLLLIAGDKSS